MKSLRLKVLLIEDDEDDYVLVRSLLSESPALQYGLEWVTTYEAALEAMDRDEHDICLLDYRLGERSGLDLLREVTGKKYKAPIIFLTGRGDYDVDFEAMKAGAADYLVKDQISVPLLERSIRYAMEHKKAEEQLRRAYNEVEIRVRERTAELARVNEALQAEIIERKHREAQVRAALEEKEVLLKEIHHRVKNNMQVISSLLNLQARTVKNSQLSEAFQESQNRIRAMILIHEILYRSENLAEINLGLYLSELVENLFRVYRTEAGHVRLRMDTEPITVGTDQAIPCGLVVNEVISNSLKYAFPDKRSGEIAIGLRLLGNSNVELIIRDNGISIPAEISFPNAQTLGLKLVFILVEEQLGGTVSLNRDNGTQFVINFRKKLKK